MRIIDRIALNRAIKIFLDFILAILKICEKRNPNISPITPKPRVRPIKNILDTVLPWRNK